MEELIISPSNPRIREAIKLKEKSSYRREQNLLVAEGLKEIMIAQQNGFRIKTLFVCGKIISKQCKELIASAAHVVKISKEAFEKIAYRENTDGLVAVIIPKHHRLSALELPANPLVVILEEVEKPGNLGAVLRTADGAGADAVIVCNPRTDIYNPNIIRSSVGCVFSKPVAAASSQEVIKWLKEKNIKSFAAMVNVRKNYTEADFSKPSAIVLGSEAKGLSSQWVSAAVEHISIPMLGKSDSLNVSVSAAVILYEAVRQRNT
jgi:TrmH family RNA methyltransferase